MIEAESNGVYQFSPLDPDDVRNEVYFQAAARADIEEDANLVAYDQAVSAAAFVFSDDTEDPTDGAFGFYSPTAIQYQKVEEALLSETTTLPTGIGTSDAQFPFFAPIQIVILPYVAGRADDETIPAFVFIRERESDEPAVVNE